MIGDFHVGARPKAGCHAPQRVFASGFLVRVTFMAVILSSGVQLRSKGHRFWAITRLVVNSYFSQYWQAFRVSTHLFRKEITLV